MKMFFSVETAKCSREGPRPFDYICLYDCRRYFRFLASGDAYGSERTISRILATRSELISNMPDYRHVESTGEGQIFHQ